MLEGLDNLNPRWIRCNVPYRSCAARQRMSGKRRLDSPAASGVPDSHLNNTGSRDLYDRCSIGAVFVTLRPCPKPGQTGLASSGY